MKQVGKRSAGKNFLFALITIFIVWLIVEIVLSVFFFHRYSDEKLATIEALKIGKAVLQGRPNSINVENQKLVRPQATDAVNKAIATETHESNLFQYASWVEFSNIDYSGEHVNILHGIRKSIPENFINSGSTDTIDIYFFGGSTMFGFNVADSETLPSQFVLKYREQFPKGRSIRVHNFATPTYYSYQELIQYANLIFQGHRPDVVIFLDGVNDFWFGRAAYYNQSYFSFVLRQVFKGDLLAGGKFQLKDSSKYMFLDPPGIPPTTFNHGLIDNYLNSIRNASMLADATGAKAYFFCQPVPFYKYPNQQKDPICFRDQQTRYDVIYPAIEKMKDSLPHFTFLGNMLEKESGYPFVDGLHYSPSFTGKVAQEILNKVGKEVAGNY